MRALVVVLLIVLASLVARADVNNSGNLVAVSTYIPLTLGGGQATCGLSVSGTFVGTVALQGQIGTSSTWNALTLTNASGGATSTSTTTTGIFTSNCAAYARLRAIATAYTSGTIAVGVSGSTAANTSAASITLAGDVTGLGSATTVVGIHKAQHVPTTATITDSGDHVNATVGSAIPLTTDYAQIVNASGFDLTLAAPNVLITGAVTPSDGMGLRACNFSANSATFTNDSNLGGTLAGSRFIYPNHSSLTLSQGGCVDLIYTANVNGGYAAWVVPTQPATTTDALPVTLGGTGVASLTSNGVVIGNGTSAVTVTLEGPTGTVLGGNTGADPTFHTLGKTCTLNGGTPSTCTATVIANAVCSCAPVGGTAVIAAAGCAVSLSSTTLTVTSGATLTNVVNVVCDR